MSIKIGNGYYYNCINHANGLVSKKQIKWRRNKVQEMLITGHNQTQIALKISTSTVSTDVFHLQESARKNMKNHLQDRLPGEYENCMAGINQVLKMSWEIATGTKDHDSNSNPNNTTSTVVDDRMRLQALVLANDCYKYKMDHVTNGVVITDAMEKVKEDLQKVT